MEGRAGASVRAAAQRGPRLRVFLNLGWPGHKFAVHYRTHAWRDGAQLQLMRPEQATGRPSTLRTRRKVDDLRETGRHAARF